MAVALTTQYDRYLVLHLAEGQLIMLPVQQLAEVFNLNLTQAVSIPDVPRHVVGVCNWRGEVTWLVDVGAWLGFMPLYQRGFSQTIYKVVLVRVGDQVVGLVVPKIGEILPCSPDQLQAVNFPLSGNLAQSCGGYILYQGQTVLALDSNQLGGSLAHG
jgi:positive phototaxis protein PixI